jgi:hypothetical protein
VHLCLIANMAISYCPLHSPIKGSEREGQFPAAVKLNMHGLSRKRYM